MMRVGHARAERRQRHGLAGMHELAHHFEQRAELAARVQQAEIHRGEAAAFQQRDRQRVAERELHQRGGGRRQIMRAGLARLRQSEHHVRGRRQRRVRIGGHRDQADAEAARVIGEIFQLRRLARPRQRDDDIVVRDHAEVAVAGFARMHEQRRRSGGGEGGGDLAPDMAGFAHAGHDHPALRGADQVDRRGEARAQAVAQRGGERIDAAAFRVERAQGGIDRRLRAVAAHIGGLSLAMRGSQSFIDGGFDSTERAARQA